MTALSAPTYSHLDALVTFMTGVVVPSGDVYTDIGLSVKLLNKSCDDYYGKYRTNPCNDVDILRVVKIQNLFGWIIWIPIVINLLFTSPLIMNGEKIPNKK